MAELERSLARTHCNMTARRHPQPHIVIAIPVCNEVERIVACMEAIEAQDDGHNTAWTAGIVRSVLLTNSCTDGTYELLLRHTARWHMATTVYDVTLPRTLRNAGHARWLANHAALDLLPARGGMLFMTDADSIVPPNWVANYVSLLRAGYDAVIGRVDLCEEDCTDLPASLRGRCEHEERYIALLDELECLLDPVPDDPWPRHYSASGANVALRTEVLTAIGDFPRVACHEDKCLARALEVQGCRVRHDDLTRVHTSGRLFGRAAGGMADTLRLRSRQPHSPCDERLELADRAHIRAHLRGTLRTAYTAGVPSFCTLMGIFEDFALDVPDWLERSIVHPFPAFWALLEQRHPSLSREAMRPEQLSGEIERAKHLLNAVRHHRMQPASVMAEEHIA
ncbi:glycosyltransferase [Dyella acidiphila]|uniref:Glycosyltransferase family 2 protein n=1 Tax=Dyella acidiphila TaxID=2775866 RepID=A0ABR9GBZ9_9GAMM|nr:glycosyltransferase family A protein [Dyella acidiphila]MBE1161556.1 glycosyltransferase family 2 protein [Dyella acidiphila]